MEQPAGWPVPCSPFCHALPNAGTPLASLGFRAQERLTLSIQQGRRLRLAVEPEWPMGSRPAVRSRPPPFTAPSQEREHCPKRKRALHSLEVTPAISGSSICGSWTSADTTPTPLLCCRPAAPVKGTAATSAAPALPLPWEASFLLDFVQQCLHNLTALHPQCKVIQAKTKAAEMAVSLFRCGDHPCCFAFRVP